MNNEQFISVQKLMDSVDLLESKLKAMTAECEKLLRVNTDLVAENNQLKATNAQQNTALDIAQNQNRLLKDANRSLTVALTETAR